MTRTYRFFSLLYRTILGIVGVGYAMLSVINPELNQDENNLNSWWLLGYCLLTVAAITLFHKLSKNNRFSIVSGILACGLTAASLLFLSYFLFTVFQNRDGNLLVTSVLSLLIAVNAMLFYYLIQDRKYHPNGQ